MDKILTIIIPTYNMSEYLDTCLKIIDYRKQSIRGAYYQ